MLFIIQETARWCEQFAYIKKHLFAPKIGETGVDAEYFLYWLTLLVESIIIDLGGDDYDTADPRKARLYL